MKPTRFFALARRAFSLAAAFTCTTGSSLALDISWNGTAIAPFDWGTATNWTPGVVPDADDLVNFSAAGVTTPQTINLNGDREALGLTTVTNLSNVATLLGGGTNRTLTLGASGINHTRGGLTIGSSTAGQRVDIILAAGQTWNSSTASGTGTIQALFVNNDVTLGTATAETLTLSGGNTGSIINGNITNGSAGGTLSINKTGSGTWTLNGTANTFTGTTTVSGGTLRLTNAGAATAANITVNNGTILALRTSNGTTGFTTAEIDAYRAAVTFNTGSALGIDTANSSGTFDYSSSLAGAPNIRKIGGNTLVLSGNNTAYTNTLTVEGGTVAFTNTTNLTGGPIIVGGSGTIVGLAGGAGFTSAELDSLRTGATYSAGGSFGISTTNGDFTYASNMGGSTRFTKAGANTLFLTGNNTHTGGTVVGSGTLSVSSLANGSTASSIGASASAAGNLVIGSARLQYTGSGASTDRLFTITGNAFIDSSGTGPLAFTATGNNAATGSSRTLTLTGYNTGENLIRSAIINGENTTAVTKTGYGNWTLSGANTYTAATRGRGGMLTLDYAAADPISATSAVFSQSGTVHFKAAAAGSSDTIASLNLGETSNGLGIVKLSGGMALTVTALNGNGNAQRHALIDLVGTGNTLTVTGINSNPAATDKEIGVLPSGLILNNASTLGEGRASTVLRANDGTYGFAAFAPGTTSGAIQKLSGQTVLAPGSIAMGSNTENYLLSGAGTYTAASQLIFSTFSIDSTAGAVDLNLSAGANINPSGYGKAILVSGTNDVNFGGAGGFLANSTWIHNYLEPSAALNISNNLGNTTYLLVGGTGFTNYTGIGLGTESASTNFVLDGGLFRVSTDQNLPTAGVYRINDAVFEVGADLSADATRDLFHSAADFRLTGDSGFSAHTVVAGGTRTVQLGSDLTWGAGAFLVNSTGGDGDHALRLSSVRSNATVDFTNNINLNGTSRTVEVAQGADNTNGVDAVLSGNLTGGTSSGITKEGAGTLAVTGTNSYQGVTRVNAGKLIVSGGGLNATTRVHVRSTLELGAGNVLNDSADITLENATFITNGNAETAGRLDLIGNNQIDLGTAATAVALRFADSSTITSMGLLAILNWTGNSTGGGIDQVYFGTTDSGLTADQVSRISFIDPSIDGVAQTGTFGALMLATGEIVAIPEPSAGLLALLGVLGLVARRRRSDA